MSCKSCQLKYHRHTACFPRWATSVPVHAWTSPSRITGVKAKPIRRCWLTCPILSLNVYRRTGLDDGERMSQPRIIFFEPLTNTLWSTGWYFTLVTKSWCSHTMISEAVQQSNDINFTNFYNTCTININYVAQCNYVIMIIMRNTSRLHYGIN